MFYFYFFFYQVHLLINLIVFFALICALMVVFSAQTVYSLLFLIGSFFFGSILFLFLGAEYIALVFIIVYVGAIAILFLFTIMVLDLKKISNYVMSFSQTLYFFFFILIISETFLSYSFVTSTIYFGSYQMFLSNFVDPHFFENHFFVFSSILFNTRYLYLLGVGFLLLLIMVGIVLLFTATLYDRDSETQGNKFLVDFYYTTKLTS